MEKSGLRDARFVDILLYDDAMWLEVFANSEFLQYTASGFLTKKYIHMNIGNEKKNNRRIHLGRVIHYTSLEDNLFIGPLKTAT